MKPNKRIILWILSVLFSVAAIAYIILSIDWEMLRTTISQLHWEWLSLALLVYALNYALRTLRFQIVIPPEGISFFQLLAVTSLHGMFNYLLPAKSGEISYVVLLKRRLGVSLVDSSTSLLAARYLDFAAIGIILPFVLIAYLDSLPLWLIYASLVFCGLILVASVGLYWIFKRRRNNSHKVQSDRTNWVSRIRKAWMDFQHGMIIIYQRRQHIRLLFLTAGIWLCTFLTFYLIVLSLDYQLSFFQIVVVSIIMIPMTLLPFQGFANLGTHEIGWVVAFSLFGQPEDVALNIAFSSHIVLLLFVLVLGAGSFLITAYMNRSRIR
ncbi:MAG: hypothetical protein B6I38_04575 [Anaerolineaceae bacterium 4572_5.1]|nr:MAG: hypothetical protein B6I38_04575 [Anaerolineaceae bacterium 4572_5.1]